MVVLICISLMFGDLEHLFTYLLSILMSSLGKNKAFLVLLPFVKSDCLEFFCLFVKLTEFFIY